MENKQNLAASIRARPQNISRKNGEEFQLLLMRFAAEGLLYRLSVSPYKDKFLLKGAALFTFWFQESHRPTNDLDLLGFGANDIPTLEAIFREVIIIDGEDSLEFLAESLQGGLIREDEIYQGVRITLTAMLGKARIPVQVDVGFGDAVTPKAQEETLHTLLDLPAPVLKIYPKETVIAEKFEAMVKLGIGNGRMKDFWDINYLINAFEFDGKLLQKAIQATFLSRGTSFPIKTPIALTEEFAANPAILLRWSGFIKRNLLQTETDFSIVINNLQNFFKPLIEAITKNEIYTNKWDSKKGWF